MFRLFFAAPGSYQSKEWSDCYAEQATITSKGQITVFREIRRLVGARSGDKFLFESDGNGYAFGR